MKQNQCLRVFLYATIFVLVWIYAGFANSKTPSHVFQQTEAIKAEVALIREAMNATDNPLEPEYQMLKKPIHVYGKGLEVLEKVSKVQKKLKLSTTAVGQIPLQKIEPTQVFQLSQRILKELGKIKSKLRVSKTIQPPPLVQGKQPSHVYRNLWQVSYMLDALVGAITPNDVFQKALAINNELDTIAGHTKVRIDKITKPQRKSGITPKEVAEKTLANFYELARIQGSIGMGKATIQGIKLVNVKPSDVFDLANMTLAELVRIKVHLGMRTAMKVPKKVTGKKPADALVMMEWAGAKIRLLKKSSNTFASSR